MLISVNSDTTSQFTPEKTNLSSEDLGGGQGHQSGTNSIVGEDAKEVGGRKSTQVEAYTPEQVQAAKDFIWGFLSELAQDYWIGISQLPTEERHSMYQKKKLFSLSAKVKDGLICEEIAVLSTPCT